MKPDANDSATAANGPSDGQPADTSQPMNEQNEAQVDSDEVKADMELD